MHLDVLKEVGNIGAAHAATSLSQLLNRKIDMYVPNVKLVSFDEMFDLAGGAETIVAGIFLRIEGDLSGSMFFVLPVESANHFIRRLIGDETFDFASPNLPEIGVSAMQELGNILSGFLFVRIVRFYRLENLSYSTFIKCRHGWCNRQFRTD